MTKTIKVCLILLVIVIILFVIVFLAYDVFKEETVEVSENTNIVDGNTGLDNVINELFENVEVNETVESEEETTENTVSTSTDENSEEDEEETEDDESDSVTSKEEKAVALVKEEWGSTDGVYFRNESIDSDGRYIVSVRDSSTTTALAFYYVDLSTGLVTEQ